MSPEHDHRAASDRADVRGILDCVRVMPGGQKSKLKNVVLSESYTRAQKIRILQQMDLDFEADVLIDLGWKFPWSKVDEPPGT